MLGGRGSSKRKCLVLWRVNSKWMKTLQLLWNTGPVDANAAHKYAHKRGRECKFTSLSWGNDLLAEQDDTSLNVIWSAVPTLYYCWFSGCAKDNLVLNNRPFSSLIQTHNKMIVSPSTVSANHLMKHLSNWQFYSIFISRSAVKGTMFMDIWIFMILLYITSIPSSHQWASL